MQNLSCKICFSKTKIKIVKTRSGENQKLYNCKNCDFEFFNFNPKINLEKNKLDVYRLKKAGLKIPSLKENFRNSLSQSYYYLNKFINKSDKNQNILEIGSAHGSFLHLLKKYKCRAFGLELNNTLRNNIKKNLKIDCSKTIEEIKKKKINFKKIFLFYSLEYFYNLHQDLEEIISLLAPGGQIIIITPNKNDILNLLNFSKGYKEFFYDKNSINYFSLKSTKNLMKKLKVKKYNITNIQGYGIVNFFNWFLNNKPVHTGLVGEDKLLSKLIDNFKIKRNNLNILSNNLKKILIKFENQYKILLEKNNVGNQILIKAKK